MALNAKEFILQERAKGTPDEQIFDVLQEQSKPIAQRGGAGELLPTAFAIGGGILGTFGGGALGGVGAIPGGIAGATAGGALGETIQQGIEKRFGQREGISGSQIAATGALSGVFQAAGGAVVKGVSTLGKFAVSKLRNPMISFFKKLSGFNDAVITKSLERQPATIEALKGGERTLSDVVINSIKGLNELSKRFVSESKEKLTRIVKDTPLSKDSLLAKALTSSAEKFRRARTEIFNKIGDFTKGVTNNLRKNHNIGVDKTGNLDFVRPNQPSRIVGGSEQSAIQEAFNLLKTLRDNLSLRHVDSIYERIVVLKSKTPTGTPTGPETKAVIGSMIDDLTNFIRKVYPKSYINLIEENLKKRVFINEAKEILGSSANPTPKEISLATSRILQLFNTGKLPIREALEEIGEKVGEDIVSTSAGSLLRTGGQAGTARFSTRELLSRVLEAVPRKALVNFVETGKLTGELLNNKILVNTAKTLGISVKALLLEMANLSTEKTIR